MDRVEVQEFTEYLAIVIGFDSEQFEKIQEYSSKFLA
jgi:hypothetical protein